MSFDPALDEIYTRIKDGDKVFLARAITWAESSNEAYRTKAIKLLERCSTNKSISLRIAVTGSPGVGKSTLIEALGISLIQKGFKVAVLAVDPSSTESHGSILGDKTRMSELSQQINAYVRPSPTGLELGGVNSSTRESILLCEAAGFNIIFIETVGVGQSEVEVKGMSDLFLLLLNPGGGDDLQGIKKGIIELADIIAVTKYDGNLKTSSQNAFSFIKQSAQVLKHSSKNFEPRIINISAIENYHIDELESIIFEVEKAYKSTGHFEKNRNEQNTRWFELGLQKQLFEAIRREESVQSIISNFRKKPLEANVFIPLEIEEALKEIKIKLQLK